MKEIQKKETEPVAGGVISNDEGCIPLPFPIEDFPSCPTSPFAPDASCIDPDRQQT